MLTKREYQEIKKKADEYVDGTFLVESMRTGAYFGMDYLLRLLIQNYTVNMEEPEYKEETYIYHCNLKKEDVEKILKETRNGIGKPIIKEISLTERMRNIENRMDKIERYLYGNPTGVKCDMIYDETHKNKTMGDVLAEGISKTLEGLENDKPKKPNRIIILEREVQDLKLKMDSVFRRLGIEIK